MSEFDQVFMVDGVQMILPQVVSRIAAVYAPWDIDQEFRLGYVAFVSAVPMLPDVNAAVCIFEGKGSADLAVDFVEGKRKFFEALLSNFLVSL